MKWFALVMALVALVIIVLIWLRDLKAERDGFYERSNGRRPPHSRRPSVRPFVRPKREERRPDDIRQGG